MRTHGTQGADRTRHPVRHPQSRLRAAGLLDLANPARRPNVLRGAPLAVFCSRQCPGRLILALYDLAEAWRAAGTPVSGASTRRWSRRCCACCCAAPGRSSSARRATSAVCGCRRLGACPRCGPPLVVSPFNARHPRSRRRRPRRAPPRRRAGRGRLCRPCGAGQPDRSALRGAARRRRRVLTLAGAETRGCWRAGPSLSSSWRPLPGSSDPR